MKTNYDNLKNRVQNPMHENNPITIQVVLSMALKNRKKQLSGTDLWMFNDSTKLVQCLYHTLPKSTATIHW